MTHQQIRIGAGLALMLSIGVGCGGASDPPESTVEIPVEIVEEVQPTDLPDPTAEPAAQDAPVESASVDAPVVEVPQEEEPAAEVIPVNFRSAPASNPDEFTSDPPEYVASTGRPQLLEFFTYW